MKMKSEKRGERKEERGKRREKRDGINEQQEDPQQDRQTEWTGELTTMYEFRENERKLMTNK